MVFGTGAGAIGFCGAGGGCLSGVLKDRLYPPDETDESQLLREKAIRATQRVKTKVNVFFIY